MRIFWKLFLSFWIALVVFTGSVVWLASHYLEAVRDQRGPRQARVEQAVAEAREAVRDGGLEGLRRWARRQDRTDAVPMLVVNEQGQDILGRDISPRAREYVERHLRRRDTAPAAEAQPPGQSAGHVDHAPAPPLLPAPPAPGLPRAVPPQAGDAAAGPRLPPDAVRAFPPREPRPAPRVTAEGVTYRLIPDFSAVTLGRVLARPRVAGPAIVLAALVGALVCFFLARYLTAPIGHLRRAMLDYAGGRLETRVAPRMGRRRDEIADLARSLDHMAERLNGLVTSHKQLLRDVSHELRSPLARLQAALGLARQRAGDGAQPELDRIERESERLNELIGRLLTLARMEAGDQTLRREAVELGEIVATVAADADMEARQRGCRVRVEGEVTGTVTGDAALLHSMLENVVRNAIKYTAPDTAVIVHGRHAEQPRPTLEIRVCDRGPGVPADLLERLFEPFVRVGDARDRATGGYGLGLAIAERAARLHGGDICAENAPGGGLCVTLTLPLAA